MTPAEAVALVNNDKIKRTEAAAKAVQDALAEHACDLLAVPQIAADGRIVAVVQIVAR
jgi:hypothetical protein